MGMQTPITGPKAAPSPYGLVAQARHVADDDWKHGVQFTPTLCYVLHGDRVDCPPLDKSAYQECQAPVVFDPYLVEIGIVWNAVDKFDPKGLGSEVVDIGTSSVLEDMITNGVAGSTNPTLDTAATTLTGTADPKTALGEVEAFFLAADAHIGASGVVHMSPQVANQVWGVLSEEGNRLYTKTTHSLVIVGNYPADTIYGHVGDIELWLDEPMAQDAGDTHKANEISIRVERLATVVWTPCATVKATIGA